MSRILVAKCKAGCVVGWSLPRLPECERRKFIENARSLGFSVIQQDQIPPVVNLQCEHR